MDAVTCCKNYFVFSLVIWAMTGYAYLVNARRPADDPQKRDFHPAAIFLAPITLPFFAVGFVFLLVLKALLYGIFLVVFTLTLIFFRRFPIFTWLDKIATKVGNILLEANTRLVKSFLSPWVGNPGSI